MPIPAVEIAAGTYTKLQMSHGAQTQGLISSVQMALTQAALSIGLWLLLQGRS